MNNEKKVYESAEIEIVSLNRDHMLLTSAGSLDGEWDSIEFGELDL